MTRRTCTRCLRSWPDVDFISSSGNWCAECIGALRSKERQAEQEKREYWQWLVNHDYKPPRSLIVRREKESA